MTTTYFARASSSGGASVALGDYLPPMRWGDGCAAALTNTTEGTHNEANIHRQRRARIRRSRRSRPAPGRLHTLAQAEAQAQAEAEQQVTGGPPRTSASRLVDPASAPPPRQENMA
jgi:hypothetical protein